MSENENIVKRACQELDITQKELAEQIDVPQSTVNRWASTNEIPKMAEKYFELLLETKDLKEKFELLKKAHKILAE